MQSRNSSTKRSSSARQVSNSSNAKRVNSSSSARQVSNSSNAKQVNSSSSTKRSSSARQDNNNSVRRSSTRRSSNGRRPLNAKRLRNSVLPHNSAKRLLKGRPLRNARLRHNSGRLRHSSAKRLLKGRLLRNARLLRRSRMSHIRNKLPGRSLHSGGSAGRQRKQYYSTVSTRTAIRFLTQRERPLSLVFTNRKGTLPTRGFPFIASATITVEWLTAGAISASE